MTATAWPPNPSQPRSERTRASSPQTGARNVRTERRRLSRGAGHWVNEIPDIPDGSGWPQAPGESKRAPNAISELSSWELRHARRAIEAAYESSPDPLSAIKAIEPIFEKASEIAELAKSRVRILAMRSQSVALAQDGAPDEDSLRIALEDVDEDERGARVTTRAAQLVRAVQAEIRDLRVEYIEPHPEGWAEIKWQAIDAAQWILRPLQTRLPFVDVQVFFRDGGGDLVSKRFLSLMSLIDALRSTVDAKDDSVAEDAERRAR